MSEDKWLDRLVWERIKELSNTERVQLIQKIVALISLTIDDALEKLEAETP